MSVLEEFQKWYKDHTGHPANIKFAKEAIDELEQENVELREALQATVELSERFVVGALTLAKHDYPLSPSSGIQLKDWKNHEEKLKQLLNK